MSRWIVPLLLAACLPLVEQSRACAPVLRKDGFAQVADESAIIIWNAKTKTEHFIRRATFLTAEKDLGFLVPTPSTPAIESASEDSFKHLEKVTEPKTRTITREYSRYGKGRYHGMKSMPTGGGMAELPTVRVVGEGRVGHLDYAILEADKTDALQQWLEKHGYAARPDLTAWLEQYVKAKWKITAFKFAKDVKAGGPGGVATSALRMTFTADRPFFPYSEPGAQSMPPSGIREARLLRVYFLGESRFRGELAGGGIWSAGVPWSNTLAADEKDELLRHLGLPAGAAPENAWLTEFEDRANMRPPSSDLFFLADSFSGSVSRPEITVEVDPPAPPGADPWRSFLIIAGITGGLLLMLIVSAFVFWR